jgi:CBS domain containing-hemolysin-like protein
LEHEEINTVSGLVLALLERPPELGDSVEYRGVRIIVEAVTGHGAGSYIVELLQPEPNEKPE